MTNLAEKFTKPWFDKSTALPESERYCTCCERPLKAVFRYLELDQRSQTYHDINDVPEDQSQGWFQFGLTCARKLVEQEKARRLAPPTRDQGGVDE